MKIQYAGSSEGFLKKLASIQKILKFAETRMNSLQLVSAHRGVKSVQILEKLCQGRRAWHYDRVNDTVTLYPDSFSNRPDRDVYEAFGQRHWEQNLTPAQQQQWIDAEVYPSIGVLKMFKRMVRKGIASWDEAIAAFKDPDDKLVIIHLVNALLKNHTTPQQAKFLNLDHYPPVAQFITAQKPYSARPLLTTYRAVHDQPRSYAIAFGEFCMNNGKFVFAPTPITTLYRALFRAVTFD